MTTTPAPESPAPAKPPRFSWPMRIFLSLLLFYMTFHSFAQLTPYREWLSELKMEQFPKPLPTWKKMAQLAETTKPGEPDPVWERINETWAALPGYFNPVPADKIRDRLDGVADWSKYTVCWLTSRLDFVENLTGFNQRWTMFSPSLAKAVTVPRLRLLYKDGTTLDLRLLCDPPDLTCYLRWFQVKLLNCEGNVIEDYDARLGYASYVNHKYGRNGHGAKLEKVYLYKVRYHFPTLDEDAFKTFQAQNGPPGWDEDGPAWVYEPNEGDVLPMNQAERNAAQKLIASAHSLGEITPDYRMIGPSP